MEQPKKNMKEISSEDEIKFLTGLKPGVTDLRPFLPKHPEANFNEPWNIIINGDGLISSISAEFFTCTQEVKSFQTRLSLEEETRYFYLMTHRSKSNSTTLIVVYRNIYQILYSGIMRYYIDNRCGLIYQKFKPSFDNWITVNDYIFNEIVLNNVINKYYYISKFNRTRFTSEGCKIFENQLENVLCCLIEAPVLFKIEGSTDLTLWINNVKTKQIRTAIAFSIDVINLLKLLGSLINISKRNKRLNICRKKIAILKNSVSLDTNFLKIVKNKSFRNTIDTYLINKYMLSMHNIIKSINTILCNHSLITKAAKFKYSELLFEILNDFYETLNPSNIYTSNYMYSINFNICVAKLNMLLILLIHKCLTTSNNGNMKSLEGNINSDKSKESYDISDRNFKLNKLEPLQFNINSTISTQVSSEDFYEIGNIKIQEQIESKWEYNNKISNGNTDCNFCVKSRNKIKRNRIRSKEVRSSADMHIEVKSNQFGITEKSSSSVNVLNRKKARKRFSSLEINMRTSLASINEECDENDLNFQMVQELSCNINSTLNVQEPNILKENKWQQDQNNEKINECRASGESANTNTNHNENLKTIENVLCDISRSQAKRSTLVQNMTSGERTVPELIQLQFKRSKSLRKSFAEYSLLANPSDKSQLKYQKCTPKESVKENYNKSFKPLVTMQNSCLENIQEQVDQTGKCVRISHEENTQPQESTADCIICAKKIRREVKINELTENIGIDNDVGNKNEVQYVDEQTTTVARNHEGGETRRDSLTNLEPYRNVIPSDAPSLPHDTWLHGGNLGNKNAVLVFRSSALANATESSVHSKPGHKLHITYRVVQAETRLLSKLLECHGILEASQNSNDFNLLWTGSHPKPGVLRSMAPHQRVNHFPRSYELTRKDRLYKNIEKMQHAKGLKHFDFIPQTFLMPTEYKELCSTHHRVKGPWIVKPAASSRGRGIYIVESPNQVPLEEPVVVAKYISKPLLVKGHKCDLRLYVAVTSFDPLLVYIYEEGMVRFATVKYDTTHKQLWNPCMHLCNYSINKYHSDYVKSDDPSAENVGHKWTLSALLRHLKTLGKDTGFLMSQVEDLVVKAILACGNSIITACKMFVPNATNCFELYGFDILIDENLKPWLLEVNLSPSLGCDSPLDVRLKSAMLSDLLTLVGIPAVDPVLRPTASPTNSSKNLKMRLSNCRRVHSADGLSNTLPKKSGTSTTLTNVALTAEDIKMVKNAKTQFERRGGFVRIFPAVDSWAKYSQYLEPLTGIPIAGSNSSLPFTMMTQHNFNQILYTQLFPDVPLVTPILRNDKLYVRNSLDRRRDASLDSVRKHDGTNSTPRQDRYERKLVQGHRSSLSVPKKQLKESHSTELKRQISDMIKSGKRMSQVEARRAFSQYLTCVLKRISSSPDQEGHVEIVLKFLQKASTYLKSPFNVKIPSQKLSDKDRAAVVAKQLNDFLYLYNRETDFYGDMNSHIPKPMFTDFLEHARESDLEEVLILQNIHTVPNKGSQSTSSFQGLLRCLPNLTGSTCFRTPDTNKKGVKGVLNLKYMCEELGYYPHRISRKWKIL